MGRAPRGSLQDPSLIGSSPISSTIYERGLIEEAGIQPRRKETGWRRSHLPLLWKVVHQESQGAGGPSKEGLLLDFLFGEDETKKRIGAVLVMWN